MVVLSHDLQHLVTEFQVAIVFEKSWERDWAQDTMLDKYNCSRLAQHVGAHVLWLMRRVILT